MGFTAAFVAISLVGTAASLDQQRKSANAQKDIQRTQRASNAAQAAEEQRKQIREERIKKAKILQASENTGVAGGSGEAGATSSIGTQLSANLNFNSGAIDRANQISIFQQNSVTAQVKASEFSALTNLGTSIFGGLSKSVPSKPVGDNAFSRYQSGNQGTGD